MTVSLRLSRFPATRTSPDNMKKKENKSPNVLKSVPQTSGGCADTTEQEESIEDPAGKSQGPGEDIKPKRGRKPKTESKTTEKSPVNMQTRGRGHKRENDEEENITAKRTRKQPLSDKKHFVIENRKKLINSITQVDPVLDDLLDKELLTQEQYDIIWKKSTSQDKMRELYSYVRSWGPKDKDTFRLILKKHDPMVIKNL
ncbi:uncharacterized protein RB166_016708 isoform 2-T3 [Leptodactylus fuscus]|uniref:uncharacterized protein LOC142217583 isoform X2 n=1 Tax=Leptodactylus fuscus TaxID=238119 RepID=UPI003F4EE5B2